MIIAWFSCGATSAIACKMALQMYKDVRIFYIETNSGHKDNLRFLKECEEWFCHPIEIRCSEKYKNVEDVLLKRKFINSPFGASCTYHLKKEVRYNIEKEIGYWDGQVWGFDFCLREVNRAIRFQEQYPNTKPLFPLIEKQITKENALSMLQQAGIEIPYMYRLGYSNNNCIGCVKGGISYWNKIRLDFPDVFKRMSEIERKIGHTCIKDDAGPIYLDKLSPSRGKPIAAIVPDCSLFCQLEFDDIISDKAKQIMNVQN